MRLVVVAAGCDEYRARLAVATLVGQVLVVRSSHAACCKMLRVETLDGPIAADLKHRVVANTDAILDRLAAEAQEQP